jgi:hypothetical protein
MSNFKTVAFTLEADVANAGTFTVAYPTGFDDGDFENSPLHYITLNGATLEHPQDIGLSFGDTSVTVTNRTGAALIAGNGYMTFFFQGKDTSVEAEVKTSVDGVTARKKVGGRTMTPLYVDFGSPLTADADGISASQSVAAAASFLLNGALLSVITDGEMVLDARYGRNVVAAWTGTAVLTIVGLDYLDQPMTEVSASGTSHTGTKAFKKILSITSSASITAATVGTGQVLGLPAKLPSSAFVAQEFRNNVPRPRKPGYMRVPFAILEAELDAATTAYVFPGVAGTIVDAGGALGDSVTTGGAITFTVSGTAVNGLTLTLANSDAAGTVYSDTPTLDHASTAVLATDYISVVPDSAINASGRFVGWVGVQPSNLLAGTFVAGLADDTKSTGTTADVRGTYDPEGSLDGSTNWAVLLMVPEAYNVGAEQYNA